MSSPCHLRESFQAFTKSAEERGCVGGVCLLADHETVIRQLRGDLETSMNTYQDAGTNDFLTGLMEQHEKMAWMLRAFLAGTAV